MAEPEGANKPTSKIPWLGLVFGLVISLLPLRFVPISEAPLVLVFAGVPIVAFMLLGDATFTRAVQQLSARSAILIGLIAVTAVTIGYEAFIQIAIAPWRWGVLVGMVAGAVLLFALGRDNERPLVTDAAAVLLIWLPIEFKLIPNLQVPPTGRGLNLVHILLVPFLVWLVLVVRRWRWLGYDLRLKPRDAGLAIAAFAVFAAIGLPLALGIQFIHPSRSLPSVFEMIGRAVVTWAFVALPEELLFRGMVQGGLEKAIGSAIPALVITSVIFGAAHLNNPPNVWRYAMLATLAGLAYGWTYLKTRNVVASSIVHLLVDWVWSVFFHG